jgi:hypothetical protein
MTDDRESQKPVPTVDDILGVHRLRRERDELKRINRDLLEQVRLSAERVDVLGSIVGEPMHPAPIVRRERTSGLREATAIAIASDWHVEETVDPSTICGVNQYDTSVAHRRSRRFFESIIWLIKSHSHSFKVRDLVLALLGDLITGYIHEELVESNSLSPTEAILFAQELITSGILMLLEQTDLERIVVPCCQGNHGRTTQKRRIATGAQNSFEWLMYHSLKQRFANEPRVEFHIAGGSHLYVDTYDFVHRFHHGDDVNYWGGTGGLHIPLRKAISSWQTFRAANFTWIGHFHQYIPDTWGACINGSLIGYGAFSLAIKADMQRPEQAFALIDSRHGKCQMTPIWVDASDAETAATVAVKQPQRRWTIKGRPLAEVSLELGISASTLRHRLQSGWTEDECLKPVDVAMQELRARRFRPAE